VKIAAKLTEMGFPKKLFKKWGMEPGELQK
jgi:hypothetical protein